MSYVIRSLFGPALNRIYDHAAGLDFRYEGNAAERYGCLVASVIRSIFSLGYYSSPFLVFYMYRRDWYTPAGSILIMEILVGFGCLYSTALCLRAVGRGVNPTYRTFLDVLTDATKDFNAANKVHLSSYDFDFESWPVEFQARPSTGRSAFVPSTEHRRTKSPLQLPVRAVSWFMVHSFGLSLIYPGSMGILQAGIAEALQGGRAKLILEKRGKRFKLKTADKNSIDAMFLDRRGSNSSLGSTLVISSEGNAGFYEVGVASTPIELGYSVLGWNQPGFGGSTGSPFPSQVANGIDTVMQFALDRLGFKPEDVVVHGWSIGGFPSTWLAMNYPDVKGLVLDATFDHLLPLAIPRMPEVMEPLVRAGVTEYVNLNVADQAVRYDGPVRLIRRSLDEMISTDVNAVGTNRGNFLLKRILQHRYPLLFDERVGESVLPHLEAYLSLKGSSQEEMVRRYQVDEEEMQRLVNVAVEADGGVRSFPSSLGGILSQEQRVNLILFLAKKYMVDYDSSHCTQLPGRLFNLPWDSAEDSFVKI